MKLLRLISTGSALLLSLALSLPAAAQMTYNFSDNGNCNFPPATCTVNGSSTVARNVTMTGWAASSGANFAAATITDQTISGVGMSASGESTASPQHAIDNDGKLELMLLNFNNNKVVLTGLQTGWSQNDTDVAVMRWIGGTDGPNMSSTANFTGKSAAQLAAMGWQIMSSHDMDGGNYGNLYTTWGTLQANTNIQTTADNSSSWWIVSAYFGGGSLGAADTQKDYFKLLSVTAKCISNTSGGACNDTTTTTPGQVPEPGSMALAGLALAGLGYSRRRKSRH